MEQNESSNLNSVISVWDLLNKLLEKWYIIVITVAVFLSATAIGVRLFCIPMYSSTAKIFIFNAENAMQSSGEITISTYLAKDYSELITDRTVLEEVIDNLDLDYNYAQLKKSIKINNPDSTRILEITVKSPDAVLSKNIADEICAVSQEKIVELMGIDRVNIISNGFVPEAPSSPTMGKYLLNALFVSLAFSFAFIFILYITNDKIESADDIEKHLGISVLATIPYSNTSGKKKTKHSSARTVTKK